MTNSVNNSFVGVINVYKEAGFTSHDVVSVMRKITKTKRIGHTGTLDPDAEGVLPICIGRATKFAEYLTANDKTYIADLVLGITTDTGDISGNILTKHEAEIKCENIESILKTFTGDILQTPPMYSAIKIGGKKLYELARKGITVERKPRPVTIYSIKIINKLTNGYSIEVSCSKGTYIRSLCEDIGKAIGCGGTMGKLLRTKSGMFSIENTARLEEIKKTAESGLLNDLILPVDKVLPYPTCKIKPDGLISALNGNPLPFNLIDGCFNDKCWLWSDDKMIGLYKREANKLRPEVML